MLGSWYVYYLLQRIELPHNSHLIIVRYRSDELVRQAGIFYVSSGVGTMTTGLLAARIYQSLDGALGHSGWRWMYIVASIMTFPIAAWGLLTFPGSPKDGKRWYWTEEEFALAKERMALEGRLSPKGLTLSRASVKRFLGRWHFWVLVPWNVMWLMGYESMITGAPALWLKSNPQYSVVQVNNYTVRALELSNNHRLKLVTNMCIYIGNSPELGNRLYIGILLDRRQRWKKSDSTPDRGSLRRTFHLKVRLAVV